MANDFLAQLRSQNAVTPDPDLETTRTDFSATSAGETQGALEERLLADSDPSRQLSVVGETLVFKGELTAEEDLLIQGQVHGSIRHNASNLTIGAHGHVKADIQARKIIVQGKVEGDMTATESITIETSARVVGNIFSPRIGIKDGAKFKGSIDMEVAVGEPMSKPMQSSAKPGGKSRSKSMVVDTGKSKQPDDAPELTDAEVDKQLD